MVALPASDWLPACLALTYWVNRSLLLRMILRLFLPTVLRLTLTITFTFILLLLLVLMVTLFLPPTLDFRLEFLMLSPHLGELLLKPSLAIVADLIDLRLHQSLDILCSRQ